MRPGRKRRLRSVIAPNRHLLAKSTLYVTLEPCSHHGKTPPCSDLIINSGFRRVVVGCRDPFPEVNGSGIQKLRQAGIEVTVGILEKECRSLNIAFFTAHTLKRPFITLKWAQSADGFIDHFRDRVAENQTTIHLDRPAKFSNDITTTMTHRLRSLNDAIAIGSETMILDNPKLNVREWSGNDPLKMVFDRRGRLNEINRVTDDEPGVFDIKNGEIDDILRNLYQTEGIISILIEGGAKVIQHCVNQGLWDFARIEVSPECLSERGRVRAPELPCQPVGSQCIEHNNIYYYFNTSIHREEIPNHLLLC